MKSSSRLDVVSAGGPGMEETIRKSLRKKFEENTNSLVTQLGEDWVATTEGATRGHRSDNVGVTVSVYGRELDKLGYRVKLDTVNRNSQQKFYTTQACSDSIVEELATISRICTELASKLSSTKSTNEESISDSDEASVPDDDSADDQ
jgi:hypothetical protein